MNILKYVLLFFFIGLLTNTVFGQSQRSFDKLISETNDCLASYATLSPFEEYTPLQNFDLSRKELKTILSDTSDEYSLTQNKDSVSTFYMLAYFQGKILYNIDQMFTHDRLTANNIVTQINTDDTDLHIAVSNDKKMYNFSLNEKSGGTYRSQFSTMYYTDIPSGNLPEEVTEEPSNNPYAVFESDGYSDIYSIDTEEGTKYVLTGYVRGCSYCFETYVQLVQFKNGSFQEDFIYSLNLRSWEDGVNYDPITKTITVSYETDDLTTECHCSNNGEDYNYNNEEHELIKKKCFCSFEFNGSNFELIEESWEKVKETKK
ncbi:MAG: hypothetical protein COA58_00175 [Bacteroidetes bacterium]|nr:MAG: hypothetical protein COA58_00175 [Bacteroidota bacterium]